MTKNYVQTMPTERKKNAASDIKKVTYAEKTDANLRPLNKEAKSEKINEQLLTKEETSPEEHGYATVSYKRKKRSDILGTKRDGTANNTKLAGIQKKLWLRIGRTGLGTTEDNVLEYLKTSIPNGEFVCEKIESKSKYLVFRVGAPLEHKEQLYSSEFWPENIQVSRFFLPHMFFRRNSIQNTSKQ